MKGDCVPMQTRFGGVPAHNPGPRAMLRSGIEQGQRGVGAEAANAGDATHGKHKSN
jgi:hypothetical protein